VNRSIESGFSRVFGAQPALPEAHEVAIECDIVGGLHSFAIVGLPDKAVEEAKDRIAAAIKNSSHDFESPKRSNKKIVFSLAPAELKKEGAVFDIPLALSFLLASDQLSFNAEKKMFAGELALDGSVRAIRGALSIALCARNHGYTELFLPRENAREAILVSGIHIIPIESLDELVAHLSGQQRIPDVQKTAHEISSTEIGISLSDIRGQESAKRGLEIAAAGRHNIALYGPPGTGKTMLARTARALLPDLSESEIIEVTTIHSYAGHTNEPVVRPPFRSPHHTSSYASLIGGGTIPRPGEVTLAHRGILFLDEFPEFHRDVVNALREPLEDAQVSVARARGSATFPANFMLIAALNPCPCGKLGTRACTCMPHAIEKYKRKISGPVADRIDMWVRVGEMPPESLRQRASHKDDQTEKTKSRIARAREVQTKRFSGTRGVATNSDMRPKEIETLAQLSSQAEETLMHAARTMKLSARGYHRTIKLARTIADLSESTSIEPAHMLEALQYREREF
jgi:magnesium chelatase family protein